MTDAEPIMDVAHLGHIELLTPTPEESLRFFVDVLGMTESGRRGQSVYLRAWDDYERYSLKLTGSNTSGLGHAAFRARTAGQGARGLRLHGRLARGRTRPWSRLPVSRSGRPPH